MKRMLAMTMMTIISVLVLSISAFAAEINNVETAVNPQTNEVEISGTIDSGIDRQVTLRIIDPNGNLEYIDQTISRAAGAFTFQYTLTEATEGTYDVEVGGEGVTTNVYTGFNYQQALPIDFDVQAVFTVGGEPYAEQLAANQMLHADVVVTNVRDQVRDVLVVIGLFDANDDLSDFAYTPVTIAANGGTAQFQGGFKLPTDVDGYYAKAYVLDGNQFSSGIIVPFTEVFLSDH